MDADLSRVSRQLFANPFAAFSAKEWWYTGIHEPDTDSWIGFFFFRSPHRDAFQITRLPHEGGATECLSWIGSFVSVERDGCLRLEARGQGIEAVFERNDEDMARFSLSGRGWEIQLQLRSTLPAFRTGHRERDASYDLLHRFGLVCEGRLRSPSGFLRFQQALAYSDHAWGRGARRTGWHWVALQNRDWCLASLVQSGTQPDRYCQVLETHPAMDRGRSRWVPLDAMVRYRPLRREDPSPLWHLESPDLALDVEWISHHTHRTRIPPAIPFLVSVDHTEVFVRAHGQVRLDGIWRPTGELHGVMELHRATW